ncbi:hypothetical protein [Cyclobacterium xiamenense]|uniref:hypothetical protein n=1 Tax=Cyclobacterium xiamenense TaxID=1297121 RepID=UPI0035D0C797
MMSEEHVERICQIIRQSELTHQALQEDLIDHFCCLVEEQMLRGQSFEEALQAARAQIAPNGWGEIQQETQELLRYNKRLRRQQGTCLSGYLFALSATLGAFFKLMQLPGATPLLYAGVLGLALVFLPLWLQIPGNRRRFFPAFGPLAGKLAALSVAVLLTAGLFKLLQLQGAGVLLGLGFLLVGFGFLPVFFFRTIDAGSVES